MSVIKPEYEWSVVILQNPYKVYMGTNKHPNQYHVLTKSQTFVHFRIRSSGLNRMWRFG